MIDREIENKVIRGMLIRLTFDGAFQRSRIYRKNVPDRRRREFRAYMASALPKILLDIQKRRRYTDHSHFKTIERFSDNVTERFTDILYQKRFRIGNAQKFLNLYWKVAWLTRQTKVKPIHCPFDSIIIKELPKSVRVPWTQFDTIEEYQQLVKAAELIIGKNNSIARWEMEIYWNAINGKK